MEWGKGGLGPGLMHFGEKRGIELLGIFHEKKREQIIKELETAMAFVLGWQKDKSLEGHQNGVLHCRVVLNIAKSVLLPSKRIG